MIAEKQQCTARTPHERRVEACRAKSLISITRIRFRVTGSRHPFDVQGQAPVVRLVAFYALCFHNLFHYIPIICVCISKCLRHSSEYAPHPGLLFARACIAIGSEEFEFAQPLNCNCLFHRKFRPQSESICKYVYVLGHVLHPSILCL